MGQTYDTGLELPQRTLLRNAVIAKLAPLLRTNGLYLTAIKPIARPYKGGGDEEGLALINTALQGQAPSILVALGKATHRAAGMSNDVGQATVELFVYVASLHARDMEFGRLAPDVVAAASVTADPGIECMLEHVQQLIESQDLGVDSIYEPLIQTEDEVWTGPDFTIWQQHYDVLIDRDIQPFRAAPLVTSFETTHSQPDATTPEVPNSANPIIVHVNPLGVP